MGEVILGGFTKLFSRILTSSIWSESNEVRIVWITLLASTGPDGLARVTVPGLSRLSNLSVQDTESALKVLASPDPYSRTVEHEGRRIREDRDNAGNLVGFYVYNYSKHRAVDATGAERQRRHRDAASRVTRRDGNARQKTEDRRQKTENRQRKYSADAERVLAYWQKRTETEVRKDSVKAKYLSRIEARLKDGATAQDLESVVDWACADDWYCSKGYVKQPAVLWRDAARVAEKAALWRARLLPANGNPTGNEPNPWEGVKFGESK